MGEKNMISIFFSRIFLSPFPIPWMHLSVGG
jgi:hypothetical protein